ncbi:MULTISPECIES: cytochrome c oxidase subunit II [Rhizobium]|uniref:Cytochrome c oxidase subunit 2 n=1 Tax=Rhizobium rhododendri TaxID=2506430 RepID=A0ABY8IJ56_9HYPH|nr:MULTISPECIES: cytochrome c oxidase subunit II [Rhizobium]MBO9097513.1 cytochrome c oxidase subunit II [Rhizobium sp. L58/93]MBO9133635.1 cytochrome c oxidase subunit II [Rhizobium sp. B209b/85]MBO9167752.1 cytochrome c oxidase subunit II [Rhizobium sp. L245/93]MBO9183711.1 cytochrome c oxidase subunit II [Rhizobium sp. E27B/91]MBZ5761070.1 cytochrome c oxidase subunit II [Rhizobium sp. VS19-DR96]
MKRTNAVLASLACLLFTTRSFADQPMPWQMGMQPSATPIMSQVRWFEQYTLWFIVPITLFVLALLIIVMIKFRASKNPVPSRTSHNTLIEVAWTIGPVLVLLFLAVPSFDLLTAQLTFPKNPDVTVKVTGTQWQWNYEYENTGDTPLAFDSYMLKDPDRAASGKTDKAIYPRLLAVDNELVLPVNKVVRVLVTAAPTDVIHSFSMPSFAIKTDAVPGRLNETWFKAEREGMFYGQCSELCGKDHAFMPIAIRIVSEDRYKQWLTVASSDLGKANKALMAEVDTPSKTVDVAANVAQ